MTKLIWIFLPFTKNLLHYTTTLQPNELHTTNGTDLDCNTTCLYFNMQWWLTPLVQLQIVLHIWRTLIRIRLGHKCRCTNKQANKQLLNSFGKLNAARGEFCWTLYWMTNVSGRMNTGGLDHISSNIFILKAYGNLLNWIKHWMLQIKIYYIGWIILIDVWANLPVWRDIGPTYPQPILGKISLPGLKSLCQTGSIILFRIYYI